MKFGFGFITCQRYPGDPRADLDLYREALELVERVEALGFDSVWVSEHHFWDDSYMPSLLVFCAAAGARTQRITLGTGVLLAPFHEPLRLAEDAATVDLLCGGRFTLGLGQGWMAHQFEAFDVPLAGRHLRLEDTIVTLRQAWSNELVTGGGGRSYPNVLVTPKPARPGGPPIWIGADREPAVRRAGRMADGYLSATAFTPALFARQVEWVSDEAQRNGRNLDGLTFSLHRPTFAWLEADAWGRVREHAYYVSWKYEEMTIARDRRGPLAAPPPLTAEPEASIRGGRGLVGHPDEIVEQLLAFQDVTPGELHFIARLYWPGMDAGLQREAIEIFAEQVIARIGAERPPRSTLEPASSDRKRR